MFDGWGMEVLQVISGQKCRSLACVNIKEGDMGEGDGPGKSDRVAAIEALKKHEKGNHGHESKTRRYDQ